MDPNQAQQTFNDNPNLLQGFYSNDQSVIFRNYSNPQHTQNQSHPQSLPQGQQPLPQFESFPQPSAPTQASLRQTLQQNPHDPYKHQTIHDLPSREQIGKFFSSNFLQNLKQVDMAPTAPVPAHLNFITGNKNKLAEVQAILEGVIELRSQNVDLVEIQGTVEEVTRDKARRAAEAVQGPVLVEDTCLCFKAMNDLPGPYIKWFMLALGAPNLHHMLDGFPDKRAQAVCTFAYCSGPGAEPVLFQGRTDGVLVESRGSTVFGWDSCFQYEGEGSMSGQTFAEMEKSEKNKISHRGKALDKLKEWLARRVDA